MWQASSQQLLVANQECQRIERLEMAEGRAKKQNRAPNRTAVQTLSRVRVNVGRRPKRGVISQRDLVDGGERMTVASACTAAAFPNQAAHAIGVMPGT